MDQSTLFNLLSICVLVSGASRPPLYLNITAYDCNTPVWYRMSQVIPRYRHVDKGVSVTCTLDTPQVARVINATVTTCYVYRLSTSWWVTNQCSETRREVPATTKDCTKHEQPESACAKHYYDSNSWRLGRSNFITRHCYCSTTTSAVTMIGEHTPFLYCHASSCIRCEDTEVSKGTCVLPSGSSIYLPLHEALYPDRLTVQGLLFHYPLRVKLPGHHEAFNLVEMRSGHAETISKLYYIDCALPNKRSKRGAWRSDASPNRRSDGWGHLIDHEIPAGVYPAESYALKLLWAHVTHQMYADYTILIRSLTGFENVTGTVLGERYLYWHCDFVYVTMKKWDNNTIYLPVIYKGKDYYMVPSTSVVTKLSPTSPFRAARGPTLIVTADGIIFQGTSGDKSYPVPFPTPADLVVSSFNGE
ncbi:TPA_asm: viral protein 1 [little skate bornavirus]|uniref:Viral protein 1 n=1 Tax=little skate bornavirus TaxID=3055759 RepID=A0AA48SG48_9MONO|nr:TPA_asm: viral protein 1 [little skate bornavirus]